MRHLPDWCLAVGTNYVNVVYVGLLGGSVPLLSMASCQGSRGLVRNQLQDPGEAEQYTIRLPNSINNLRSPAVYWKPETQ